MARSGSNRRHSTAVEVHNRLGCSTELCLSVNDQQRRGLGLGPARERFRIKGVAVTLERMALSNGANSTRPAKPCWPRLRRSVSLRIGV